MGAFLSTTLASQQVVAAGGVLSGDFKITSPGPGHYYGILEQYTSALAPIPGSRSYFHYSVALAKWVNSTTDFSVVISTVAGEEGLGAAELTLPNTNCYLYVFLKRITTIIVAGALVVGTTYKIVTVGTTNFTLVGAAANVVGTTFVATGAGAGTGTVCGIPDPDVDETLDYVVLTIVSSSTATQQIDLSSLMGIMISFMIVAMMMGMMTKAVSGLSGPNRLH